MNDIYHPVWPEARERFDSPCGYEGFPDIRFVMDDANRYSNERGDCTVRATKILTGETYPAVHSRLSVLGRKFGEGFSYSTVAEHFGFVRRRDLEGGRLAKSVSRLPRGRFAIGVPQHVLAVKENVVYDTFEPSGNEKVLEVWEVPA